MFIDDFDDYKLKKIASYVKNGVILDIGFAQKPNKYLVFDDLYGLDIQKVHAPDGYKYVKNCNLNTESIPFKTDFFDCVLIAVVLEHLENPSTALREISRILKPRGTLIITTPNVYAWNYCYANYFDKEIHKEHISWYCTRSIKTQLFFAGFKVKKLFGAGFAIPFMKKQLSLSSSFLSHTLIVIAKNTSLSKNEIITKLDGVEVSIQND